MNKVLYISICLFVCLSCAKKSGVATNGRTSLNDQTSPKLASVYFPFASDLILPEAEEIIARNAEALRSDPYLFIILEGHCDEVGPKEFNMELGDRRARAVKASLIEKDVPSERVIMLVSYGSTRPMNQGHKVEDLRQNRRVEFVVR